MINHWQLDQTIPTLFIKKYIPTFRFSEFLSLYLHAEFEQEFFLKKTYKTIGERK